jgi:DNA-binding transcriptional LysR family regulator
MPSDDLDWNDLRYFARAAQAKSLSGAARQLRVEHSTVGRRLDALEQALGVSLVLRGPDGLQLTRLGTKVAALVVDVERAVAVVRDAVDAEKARVRLAVPSGFTKLFTAALPELTRTHPGLSLELVSAAGLVDLAKGEADLAVRGGTVAGDDLVARKLGMAGFAAYASNAYLARRPQPVNVEDLSGHDVIGFDPALAALPGAKWLEQRACAATVVLRSREMTEMLAAAASGAGIAVLPCLLGDAEPTLSRLTPEVVATMRLSLVYRREASLSKNVRAVIRFVTGTLRAQARSISGEAARAPGADASRPARQG